MGRQKGSKKGKVQRTEESKSTESAAVKPDTREVKPSRLGQSWRWWLGKKVEKRKKRGTMVAPSAMVVKSGRGIESVQTQIQWM